MISSIEISGYATYKKSVKFDFTAGKTNPSKLAVIYGQNGTGKSTFTKLVRERIENPSSSSPVVISHNMGDSFVERVLIYDKKFVSENFEASETQPGLFSLGNTSIETEKHLKEEENRCIAVKEKLDNILQELDELEKKRSDNKKELKDELFEIKRKYENSKLRFCLDGVRGSKDALLEKILTLNATESDGVTVDMLEKQAAVTQSSDAPALPDAYLEENKVETDPIWGQAIVPIGESCYKKVIDQLGSHQWIKQGIKYAEQINGLCPFCQQDLSSNTIDKLKIIFDRTYERSRATLEVLKNQYQQYETGWRRIREEWDSFVEKCGIDSIRSMTTEMTRNINRACAVCEENSRLIAGKLKKPELVITLTSTNPYIDTYRSQFEEIKSVYKRVTDNKEISDQFWKIMRNKYDPRIQAYYDALKTIESDIENKSKIRRDLQDEHKSLCSNVAQIKAQLYSYEYPVQEINNTLEELGIQGFSLTVDEVNGVKKYRIVRDGDVSDVYRSLSEGEKTIITLLYFCGCFKSKKDILRKDNVVVILDDPVSSLSANHLYNICQIINERLLKDDKNGQNYDQVILLTHSIFFVYEIEKVVKRSMSIYYLLSKSEGQSEATILKNGFSISLYDSYWDELCKIKSNKNQILAPPQTFNIMRNIIERFFGFIERDDLRTDHNAKKELNSADQAFLRRIYRESHSDMKNELRRPITFDEIWRQFKNYFKNKGYEEHFELLCKAGEKKLDLMLKPDKDA